MATTATATKLSGLARMLVKEELLSEQDATALQSQADIAKIPFIAQVITSKKLTAEKIADVSSKAFGFPYFISLGLLVPPFHSDNTFPPHQIDFSGMY